MADLRDFTGKNRKFTGTIGERISTGTTAERDTSFAGGTIRFNTTTSLMEYYDGAQWKPIDAPPTIASVSPATFASDGSTIHTITVSGGNFGAGLTAKFIGQDGTEYTPGTTTVVSLSIVTMTTLTSMTVANEPYDIKITNVSGLSATIENALDAGSTPAFTAAAGSLGTLPNGNRAATALTSQTFGPATDADGQQINYTITSGSLPSGLRLGTPNDGNNGKILGTADAVGTNTTSSFTIQASDGVNTNSRAYSITVSAPVIETFTSSGTFNVPSGLTSVDVLVVAGGGGTGERHAGGGGAGGLIFRPGFTVSPGTSIPVTVGGGGIGANSRGLDSVFSTLTAKGGGSSATSNPSNHPGGSGAGSSHSPTGIIGIASQPSQPGDSGTFGFGTNGGSGFYTDPSTGAQGGGGGGAGAAGGNSGPNTSGTGGAGREYSISGSPVYYAGGGCGGGHTNAGPATGGIGGGGSRPGSGPGQPGQPGVANRGGGGGGGNDSGINPNGGSGVVIVKY